jgi:NADH-quinone oxidoreductase subunit B
MTSLTDPVSGVAATTTRKKFISWLDQKLIEQTPWSFPLNLSCCSLEYHSAFFAETILGSQMRGPERVDIEEADLLVFGGSINLKLIPYLVEIHKKLRSPKWVLGIGSCAASGGLYQDGHAVWPGLHTKIPVDLYIPGCPPDPTELRAGFEMMRLKMQTKESAWSKTQEKRIELTP